MTSSGVVADFMTINRQHQGSQSALAAQTAMGMPAVAGPNSFNESTLMSALNTIQQNIIQLQAMVPHITQNQPLSVAVQQQAAAAISQLSQLAASMFPPNQGQQQQPQQQQPQPPMSDPHLQQLSQLFGAFVTPAFTFSQRGGSAQGNNNSGGNNGGVGNKNFPTREEGGNVDIGTTATSLANQIAAIDRGVSGNPPNGAGLGLGVPSNPTPSGGGQSFGHRQVGANHAPSVPNTINPGMVVRPLQGSPRNSNHMGNSVVAMKGMGGDTSHMGNDRSVNSGGMTASPMEDHDSVHDDDDVGDGESLFQLVEMLPIDILAEHTHFCEKCKKGFKREANLRMHMRGHGDEYKTPAALARPDKPSHEVSILSQRRYSCPCVGCKRNKKHSKFLPLKTILCVKNHYRRSHCPKILTCKTCKTKKFSVVADLKTHEKHCGSDKWQCSCGIAFFRKDKLVGHIGQFKGHTLAMPSNDVDASGGLDESEMSSLSNDVSDYELSGAGTMDSGSGSSMGLHGGSGMGMQALASQGGNPGCGGLNISKGGNALALENSSSSDSFPSAGLISGSGMPINLQSNWFC